MESSDIINNNAKGFAIWITGLPYTRKKQTAELVRERLDRLGYKSQILVGGQIRRMFEQELGFTREETYKNIRRIAFECKLLAENGIIAIAVTISPYKDLRQECRELIGRFIEVYHTCPIEVLKERDVKHLFERAEKGELKNVAGISIPYEESDHSDVVIDSAKVSPEEAANKIIIKAQEIGYLEEADNSVLLKEEEKDIRQILRKTWFK